MPGRHLEHHHETSSPEPQGPGVDPADPADQSRQEADGRAARTETRIRVLTTVAGLVCAVGAVLMFTGLMGRGLGSRAESRLEGVLIVLAIICLVRGIGGYDSFECFWESIQGWRRPWF